MRKLLILLTIYSAIALGQTQEDIWQFSHSINIPSVDTPWMGPDCVIYPHSSGTQAYHASGCTGTAQGFTWTHGPFSPYWYEGGFTSEKFGTDHIDDLSLIVPSFPNEPSCGTRPRYNQYADIDTDGVNERLVHIYGCNENATAIDTYLLDHDGTDWQYTHYPNALLFAADTDNDGQLELVDLMNDFNGDYIGDGFFKYLDLDNNGYRDFVFLVDHSTQWGIWLNTNGVFTELTGSLINASGRYTNFTDFNNDGKIDLAVFDPSASQINVYQNVNSNPGTWVTTGASFGDEVIINGQVIAFHPEDRAERALTVGDPIHVAGSNPSFQIVSKITPPLQDGTVPNPDPDPDPEPPSGGGLTFQSGYALVATSNFCDGHVHWAGGGCNDTRQWVPIADYSQYDYIAADLTDFSGQMYYTPWKSVSLITENDWVLTCPILPAGNRWQDCYSEGFFFQKGTSDGTPPPDPDPVPVHVFVGTVEDWILCADGNCDEANTYTSEAAVKSAAEALPDTGFHSWYKKTLNLYDLEWQ